MAMPDMRTLNRLFQWLVTVTSGQSRLGPKEDKKQGERKARSSTELVEGREAKAKALSEKDKRTVERIGERGLLTYLHNLIDLDAVAAAYKKAGIRHCEVCLRTPGGGMFKEEVQEMKESELGVVPGAVAVATGEDALIKEEQDDGTSGGCKWFQPRIPELVSRRICCALILYSAPIPDEDDPIPSSVLAHIYAVSRRQKRDESPSVSAYYSWSDVLAVAGIEVPDTALKLFYEDVWLPFCIRVSRPGLTFSAHKRLLPDPYQKANDHHVGARGLCQIFLMRQQIMRAIRFVLSHKLEELDAYLRSPSGRDMGDSMPVWWCPWIHDLSLMFGFSRHGYMALEKIVQDEDLPFTKVALEQHIRLVFFTSTATCPAASYGLLEAEEEQSRWVDAARRLLPDSKDYEDRMARILTAVTASLPSSHPYRIRPFVAVPGQVPGFVFDETKAISDTSAAPSSQEPESSGINGLSKAGGPGRKRRGRVSSGSVSSVVEPEEVNDSAAGESAAPLPPLKCSRLSPALPLHYLLNESVERRRLYLTELYPMAFGKQLVDR